jgi:hypothetical protein
MKVKIPITDLSEFGPRLVTLCDGRPGLRGALHMEVREPDRQVLECASPLALSHGETLPLGDAPSQNPKRQPRKLSGGALQNAGARSEPQSSSPVTCHPSPVLDFIASDETLDRYDEIIVAGGWRLDNYQRNPVFQNAHQYGDIIFTLGKALITEVRPVRSAEGLVRAALFQRIEFVTEVNPMARIAYGLYKGGFLNAVSVGFIPLKWENGDGRQPSAGRDAFRGVPLQTSEFRDAVERVPTGEKFRRRYLEQELLEVSAVGIPANPNALQLGLQAGAIEKADLQETLELLRALCAEPDVPGDISPPDTDEHGRTRTDTDEHRGTITPQPHHSTTPLFHFCSNLAGSATDTGALGGGAYEAQLRDREHATESVLLQLARAIRDTLKRKT